MTNRGVGGSEGMSHKLIPNIRYSAVDKPARLTIVLDCDTSAVTP